MRIRSRADDDDDNDPLIILPMETDVPFVRSYVHIRSVVEEFKTIVYIKMSLDEGSVDAWPTPSLYKLQYIVIKFSKEWLRDRL